MLQFSAGPEIQNTTTNFEVKYTEEAGVTTYLFSIRVLPTAEALAI